MSAQSVRIITDLSVDYVLKGSEDVIIFNDVTNLAATFDLGPAYGDGRQFTLKNIGTCVVSVYPATGETIENQLSFILNQRESIVLCDFESEKWVTSADLSTGLQEDHGINHVFFVDGSRTDTYNADGSMSRPYQTISEAQTAINVLSAALLDSAAHFELCKFIVNIAPGKYTANVAISTVRYLRWNMEGVEVSGNVTITQNQLGLTDYYGKVEFFGGHGNRAYRGNCGLFSGTITFLKDAYDSLAYDAFIGCNITGNLQYGTSAADTCGTWVLCLINSYFQTAGSFISAYLSGATMHVMIESYGYNKIVSHIAKQDGSATKVTIYDCNNTYFDLVNSTPLENGVIKNCTFNSTTSIVAAKTLSIDDNSLSSLLGQTPTLTGMTLSLLDSLGSSATAKTIPMGSSSFLGRQSNVVSITNPGAAVTLAGGYFKAALTTANQANLQICGLLSRASMGKNCIDAYGIQSHTTLVDGAESTGNMTAVSGKTILYDNNASGIVTAGLFTLEGQASTTHGAVPRVPNTAYGVWIDVVDTNTTAGLEINANNSALASGIKIDKMGTGAIIKDITLQNGETISNATDGKVIVSGVLSESTSIAYSTKTVKKTIGISGCDFNVDSTQANPNEQNFNLFAIPALARIVDVFTHTDAAFTHLGSTTVELGTASSGAQFFGATVMHALNTIIQTEAEHWPFAVNINAAATALWAGFVPSNNWNSANPVGKISVYITYIDVTNI
jgi:hypothetical protein